ncbi:MAG: MBL fold metallo-hydrolase, partial [Proteobacteria bacterium]
GYLFESADHRVLFDPIFESPFSHNCFADPPIRFDEGVIRKEQWNAVIISHFHDDHLSLRSLDWISRETPIYLYCAFEEFFDLVRQMGFIEVHSIQLNVSLQFGGIRVTALAALNPEVDTLFHVQVGVLNILNVVDSWIDPSNLPLLSALAPWDLVLWPFQTMRELAALDPRRAEPAVRTLPPEWIEQLVLLRPKCVIPSACQFRFETESWLNHHYFPISYRQFEREMVSVLPATQVVRLGPSESIKSCEGQWLRTAPFAGIELLPAPMSERGGDVYSDYELDDSQLIPSTLEVARLFPQLSAQETAQVLRFCANEMCERYAKLDLSEDDFFHSTLSWQLKLYDAKGTVHTFQYQIDDQEMSVTAGMTQAPDWLTEISIWKLYSAVFRGESLSSLYLRVNDFEGNVEVEDRLRRVDVLRGVAVLQHHHAGRVVVG